MQCIIQRRVLQLIPSLHTSHLDLFIERSSSYIQVSVLAHQRLPPHAAFLETQSLSVVAPRSKWNQGHTAPRSTGQRASKACLLLLTCSLYVLYCRACRALTVCICVQGDESRAVFKFTPLIAPVKATVFPLLQKPQLSEQAALLNKELTAAGLSNIIDTTGGDLVLCCHTLLCHTLLCHTILLENTGLRVCTA